jgi:hypothetical protein
MQRVQFKVPNQLVQCLFQLLLISSVDEQSSKNLT